MNFKDLKLIYNAAAHFAAQDKFPDGGLIKALIQPGTQGLDALCWALEEMSTQWELIRKEMGYEPKAPIKAETYKRLLRPADLPGAKAAVLEAIKKGTSPTENDDEEVDEVLAEIQKKTAKV